MVGDGMTREEAIGNLIHAIRWNDMPSKEALDMAIKTLEIEPFTDTDQRIFLAAMRREEKVCKEVCADGHGKDLVAVCHSIERKVKKALWG